MKKVMLVLVLLGLVGIAAGAQTVDSKKPTVPTEVEQLRMQIAGLMSQLRDEVRATHRAIEERDDARLALVMQEAAPVRDGFSYDWSVGRFRSLATGQVWDFQKQALVDDEKTPKKKDD